MCGYDPDEEYKSWLLVYPGQSPSQNMLKGNSKGNYLYRKWRKSFQKILEKQMKAVPPAQGRRIGVLTRYWAKGCRPYDLENLVGGLKPLIDVLKRNGVIIDDAPKWWRGYYRQEKSADGANRLEIEIRESVDVQEATE
jgi:Holliday junction resolvase RusA-like endonuclease